jgi:two-component system sensor histidine kinase KdpD
VLNRRPTAAVVDELALTCVPGSRHENRWEDVEELLDAGIDVITSLNVQHLDSLNDSVESLTGVAERETVPDAVVATADRVELIDVSPQRPRERIATSICWDPAQRILR